MKDWTSLGPLTCTCQYTPQCLLPSGWPCPWLPASPQEPPWQKHCFHHSGPRHLQHALISTLSDIIIHTPRKKYTSGVENIENIGESCDIQSRIEGQCRHPLQLRRNWTILRINDKWRKFTANYASIIKFYLSRDKVSGCLDNKNRMKINGTDPLERESYHHILS